MKKRLVKVSEDSNFELNEQSTEMLLQTVCKSYECDDFRSNNCRMKTFLTALEDGSWQWSQTWMTPTKFLLHLVKHGANPTSEVLLMFEDVKKRWECLGSDEKCGCNFFDEMKNLNRAIEKAVEKQSL